MFHYDYIILGAGAAGLSLLVRMIDTGKFSGKKILLIDKQPKIKNDRTWCFWEKVEGYFEDIVYKKWDQLYFQSNTFSSVLNIAPYRYKMIRGIDFYDYCFKKVEQQKNIDIQYGEINSVFTDKDEINIIFNNQELKTGQATVFNSLYNIDKAAGNYLHLLQHFKGWIIEAEKDSFNENVATLMDFRVNQECGTTFVYVLPFSNKRALVEYTLFSEKALLSGEYDQQLKYYIKDYLLINNYKIIAEESGAIPMTNYPFPFYHNGIYNIGTAGGQTKASTGYTFPFIQKQTEQIVHCLINNRSLKSIPYTSRRFRFYDSVLLCLLAKRKPEGREIFSRLFQRNRASSIFKFLDNESTLKDEIPIIASLQTWPFLRAAWQHVF